MRLRFFRSRRSVERDAGRWLARMRGRPGEADRRAFIAWCNEDPAHREAYDALARLWDAAPATRLRSSLAQAQPPVAAAPAGRWLALAALLLGTVGLGALIIGREQPFGSAGPQPAMLLLATGIGEIREVPLDNGTRVTLDTDSAVRVERDERLQLRRGRARFDVRRPTRVSAGAAVVRASRAVFDVRLDAGVAVVTPLRGSVEVTGAPPPTGAARIVEQGRAEVLGAGQVRLAEVADRSAAWPSGMLEFEGASLADVVSEANRYSRRKIRLVGAEAADLKVTGAFRAGDVQGLARSLAAAFDLELRSGEPGFLELHARR